MNRDELSHLLGHLIPVFPDPIHVVPDPNPVLAHLLHKLPDPIYVFADLLHKLPDSMHVFADLLHKLLERNYFRIQAPPQVVARPLVEKTSLFPWWLLIPNSP